MKQYFITAVMMLVSIIPGHGQAELMTKKKDIGDISGKITKIVISGNDAFLNMAIEDEIKRGWTVTRYECGDMDEFEKAKCDTNYFFLIRTKGQYKGENEPSIEFLSLLRGGPKAEEGISSMTEVISIPFKPARNGDGKYVAFMPAFIDIIQEQIPRITKSDVSAYTAMHSYTKRMYKSREMHILMGEQDISRAVDEKTVGKYFDENMRTASSEEIEAAMQEMRPNTLVSYTIVPENGKYCFKMLISTEDHGLYYFTKHRISDKRPGGFIPKDIRKIAIARKNGK